MIRATTPLETETAAQENRFRLSDEQYPDLAGGVMSLLAAVQGFRQGGYTLTAWHTARLAMDTALRIRGRVMLGKQWPEGLAPSEAIRRLRSRKAISRDTMQAVRSIPEHADRVTDKMLTTLVELTRRLCTTIGEYDAAELPPQAVPGSCADQRCRIGRQNNRPILAYGRGVRA